jgi:hypothetical protein
MAIGLSRVIHCLGMPALPQDGGGFTVTEIRIPEKEAVTQ